MSRHGRTLALLALFGVASLTASRVWAGKPGSFLEAVEREKQLAETMIDIEAGLVALEQERASTAFAQEIMEHRGAESLRRLGAYQVRRKTYQRQAKARARSLYKLSRGGLLRVAFEDVSLATQPKGSQAETAERISSARTVRWLVAHDLSELAVHQRAEGRAQSELLTTSREMAALSSLRMVADLSDKAMTAADETLGPELRRAKKKRLSKSGHLARGDKKALLELQRTRRELNRASQVLARKHGLTRPVGGRVIGRFGTYVDEDTKLELQRNGIELVAKPGRDVGCAAGGTVAFVGELPGYEQVVVVEHDGGYLSMTARMLDITVEVGDVVVPGQALGIVAPKLTDDGLGPTVYFELRHGERPVDPKPYLTRRRRR